MVLLLLACVAPDPEAARRERLRAALVDENLVWVARDPDRVAEKFAKMDGDVYDFLRGSAGFWWADLARPDLARAPTAFLRDPRAATLLIVGDAHLENWGTALGAEEPSLADADPAAPLLLEPMDLDAAGFGPWTLDTRRTALALAQVAAGLYGCDDACVEAVVAAYAGAAVEEIAAQAAGADPVDARAEDDADGRFVAELREGARADGVEQAALAELTVLDGVTRRFDLDAGLDADGDGLLAPTAAEAAQVERLLAAWTDRPAGFRALDAARAFGKGVASLPAWRYYVLWDQGDASPLDDRVLQLREVADPPALPGIPLHAAAGFDDGPARVTEAARRLWSTPDADPLHVGLADGPVTFKLTTESGWYQTFDHEAPYGPFLTGDAELADLTGLAARLGRLHAAALARGGTAEGEDALPVLVAELDGRGEAFVAERVRDAFTDRARLEADAALFHDALVRHGPLLGAETIPGYAP